MHFTHAALSDPQAGLQPVGDYVGGRYGYEWADQELVRKRVDELLAMFAARLHRQRQLGSPYYLGDQLTAADINLSFPIQAARLLFTLAKFPRLAAFLDRVHARPAYKRALERGGPYIFGS